MEHSAILIDRVIKQYNGTCPDCGNNEAIVKVTNIYDGGVPGTCSIVDIECPNCYYYEWYTTGSDE